ncbi:MAG: sugar ABC transporter permease [Treponema sp.]|nr:sugar ABC transporter permease [Candidatus Treponema merdequi]
MAGNNQVSKPAIAVKGTKQLGSEAKLQKYGVFFVIPFIVIYLVFQLWPTIYTVMLAFTDLKGFATKLNFVGLKNFARLIHDKFFWGAIGNTFIMWLFNFIPQLGIALLFAIWFTDPRMHLKCKNTFRALFYMPNLLTAASVAILFRSLFGYPNGPINQFLYSLGIQHVYTNEAGEVIREGINFFRSIPWSRGIVSFIQWWLWCGQTLIMLMAGITSISPSLYESAVVDGANQGQQTWYITLPLLKPMMLYILITGLIGGMQLFEIPFLLTDMYGGPQNKIRTMVVYMYNQAFQGVNDYAYGSAIAMGVFIITMVLSMFIYFFMQDRSDMGRKN